MVPISPHPHLNYFLSFFFFTVAILKDVKWYLMVLIRISLMISDVKHLFMCLLAVSIAALLWKKNLRITKLLKV